MDSSPVTVKERNTSFCIFFPVPRQIFTSSRKDNVWVLLSLGFHSASFLNLRPNFKKSNKKCRPKSFPLFLKRCRFGLEVLFSYFFFAFLFLLLLASSTFPGDYVGINVFFFLIFPHLTGNLMRKSLDIHKSERLRSMKLMEFFFLLWILCTWTYIHITRYLEVSLFRRERISSKSWMPTGIPLQVKQWMCREKWWGQDLWKWCCRRKFCFSGWYT